MSDYFGSIRHLSDDEPAPLYKALRVIHPYLQQRGARVKLRNLKELLCAWLQGPLPPDRDFVSKPYRKACQLLAEMRESEPQLWRTLDKTHLRWSMANHWQLDRAFRQRAWILLFGTRDAGSILSRVPRDFVLSLIGHLARAEAVRIV